jgi:hypothetical protein
MYYNYLNIPNFISLITTDIFTGCESLNNFTFLSTTSNSASLPNTIEQFGENVFENCQKLRNVFFQIEPGSNLNLIPNNTFKGCTNLSNVYLSSNIEIIGESAFENCQNLIKFKFPPNLITIQNYSFKNCTRLEQIMFLNNPDSISTNAFQNCEQFSIANNSLVVANEPDVSTFFNNLFPNIRKLKLDNYNLFAKNFYDISTLLNIQRKKTKQYFYPSLGVILTALNQIVNINLINNDIVTLYNALNLFRNLILNFIFEINSPYNNFVISNTNLNFTLQPISNPSYNVIIYNKEAQNINALNDLQTLGYSAIYGLLSNNYTQGQINNYQFQIDVNTDNTYDVRYSNNNFNSTFELTNQTTNKPFLITNFTLLTGNYQNFIIYKNFVPLLCNFYLDKLNLTISSQCSELVIGETTTEFNNYNAITTLNIPLAVVTNTFLYSSDSINVNDDISQGVKFKVDYSNNQVEWNQIIPTMSATNIELGAVPYYKKSGNNTNNVDKIKYDFIRYISLKLFGTGNGADLFRNNEYVASQLDYASNNSLKNKLIYLESLGEMEYSLTNYNVSRELFSQIIYTQPERITQVDANVWMNMPLYVGDKLFFKLTILPHASQYNVLKKNNQPIDPRIYLVEINLI